MEEIKKSMDKIRESVGRMRQIEWNQKLENEYTKILEEIAKVEKELKSL